MEKPLEKPIDVIQIITDRPDYGKKIILLIEKRVLDIKNGSATLHFNNDGVLMSIETNVRAYNYKKE